MLLMGLLAGPSFLILPVDLALLADLGLLAFLAKLAFRSLSALLALARSLTSLSFSPILRLFSSRRSLELIALARPVARLTRMPGLALLTVSGLSDIELVRLLSAFAHLLVLLLTTLLAVLRTLPLLSLS